MTAESTSSAAAEAIDPPWSTARTRLTAAPTPTNIESHVSWSGVMGVGYARRATR